MSAACTTDPYTGQQSINRTAVGIGVGALGGYLLGDLVGGSHDRNAKVIGMGIGALAGGQTLTPAISAVQEKADSQTPILGYTVPYALANILLTMWGAFMVMLRAQFG